MGAASLRMVLHVARMAGWRPAIVVGMSSDVHLDTSGQETVMVSGLRGSFLPALESMWT